MAVVQKQLALAQLDTTGADVYTVPANTRAVIWKATVDNVNASARTITVYFVPSGDSPADENTVIKTVNVPAAGSGPVVLDLAGHVIPALAAIHAVASANSSLTLAISGVEVS